MKVTKSISFSLISFIARYLDAMHSADANKQYRFKFKPELVLNANQHDLDLAINYVTNKAFNAVTTKTLTKQPYLSVGKLAEHLLLHQKNKVWLYDNLRSNANKASVQQMLNDCGFNDIVISETNYRKTKKMIDGIFAQNPILRISSSRVKLTEIGIYPSRTIFTQQERLTYEHEQTGLTIKSFVDLMMYEKNQVTVLDVKTFNPWNKGNSQRGMFIHNGYPYQLALAAYLAHKTKDISISNKSYIIGIDTSITNGSYCLCNFSVKRYLDKTLEMVDKIAHAMKNTPDQVHLNESTTVYDALSGKFIDVVSARQYEILEVTDSHRVWYGDQEKISGNFICRLSESDTRFVVKTAVNINSKLRSLIKI